MGHVTAIYRVHREMPVGDISLLEPAVAILLGAGPAAYLELATEVERRGIASSAQTLAKLDGQMTGPAPALTLARHLAWPPSINAACEVLCRSCAILMAEALTEGELG